MEIDRDDRGRLNQHTLEVPGLVRQRSELCFRDLRECFRLNGDGKSALASGDDDLGEFERGFVNEGGGDAALAERQELRVLAANFRNGLEATRVANQLLKIKQRRFGSIDRESNFLVDAVGGDDPAAGFFF